VVIGRTGRWTVAVAILVAARNFKMFIIKLSLPFNIGGILLRLLHCVSKNIPDNFDCNLKTNYQILIIFDTNRTF